MAIAALSGWTSEQKHVVAASFLGWSLDAFDFFLLVFVLKDIAAEFHTDISTVTWAILLSSTARSAALVLPQASLAAWAASSARSMSAASERAISHSTAPFTGEVFSKYRPFTGSTQAPPM